MNTIWLEASAGTGKTTFLLSQIENFRSEEIMFITFSNAAADELSARVKESVYITTLHALAYKVILNRFEDKEIATNSKRNVAILKMLDNQEFLELIIWMLKEKIMIDESLPVVEKPVEISRSQAPNGIIEHQDILADNQIIATQLLEKIKLVFFTKTGEPRKKMPKGLSNEYVDWAINRILIHEKYKNDYAKWVAGSINALIMQEEQRIKDSENLLYYNDLITLANEMLKQEENMDLLYQYFGNIKLLLIDEAQDLATAQWELIMTILEEWSLLDGTLIVASDKKQLIYEFQGASIESFENSKKEIAKLSKTFEVRKLNHTYRLPKKLCQFLNKLGPTLNLDYEEHSTQRNLDGDVEILLIDDISEIADYIKLHEISRPMNDVMVLYKYKTERIEKLAHAFFANGLMINSPFSLYHPVIKDFQYLVDYIYNNSIFAKQILLKIMDTTELAKFQHGNLIDLAASWITHKNVQKFLNEHLKQAKNFWENALMQYAKFYEYDPISAINDDNNFYKSSHMLTHHNLNNIFASGVFLNTIHSSKGMEANYVFLCDTDFVTRMESCDTHRLFYVGLTRAKEKLIIPIFRKNLDKLEGTWAENIVP